MGKKRKRSTTYAERIARGLARGLTRSQARGHPRRGEAGIKAMKFDPALEDGLKAMRGGLTLQAAGARQRVSHERLSRYAKSQAGASWDGRNWTFNDTRKRRVQVINNGAVISIWVAGYEPSRIAGQYLAEAARMIEDTRRLPNFMRRWENRFIRDADGRRHLFSINPNEIYRAIHANDRPFEQIYKLVMAE